MKKKDFQQLKTKPEAEIEKDLVLSRAKLSKLNFDLAAGKVKNIKEIKATKKVIARILTILNNKTRNV